jgi:hypothetical protein
MAEYERPVAIAGHKGQGKNNKNWVTITLGPFPLKEWNVPCDSWEDANDLYNCIRYWHLDTLDVAKEMRLIADKLEGK